MRVWNEYTMHVEGRWPNLAARVCVISPCLFEQQQRAQKAPPIIKCFFGACFEHLRRTPRSSPNETNVVVARLSDEELLFANTTNTTMYIKQMHVQSQQINIKILYGNNLQAPKRC